MNPKMLEPQPLSKSIPSWIATINRNLGWSFWIFIGVFLFIFLAGIFPDQFLGDDPGYYKWWNIIEFVQIYILLALGLNIVVGYMGLLDLGYVTFLATGAVITSIFLILTQTPEGWILPIGKTDTFIGSHLFDFEAGYLILLIFSGILCAAIGFLRGIPTLKLTGDYYAIVTLGLAEIVYLFFYNEEWLTGGAFGIKFKPDQIPILAGEKLYYDTLVFYMLILATTLLAIVSSFHLRLSRVGRAWNAIRLDETAARSVGIDTSRYKMLGFAISGFFGGVGGGLFAIWLGTVAVKDLDVWQSILILCGVVLGGMGSIRGVIVGTTILIALREVLKDPIPLFGLGQFRVPPEASFLVYGLLLIMLMRFRPQGLIPPKATGLIHPPKLMLEAMSNRPVPLFALQSMHAKNENPWVHPQKHPQNGDILVVQNFSKFFGGVHAVEGVNLKIQIGSITSLIGPNGAGKTTLFNGITGIFLPTSGQVIFQNSTQAPIPITALRPDKICGFGIARTFQNIRLFHNFTVLENVKIGLHAKTHSGPLASILRLPAMRREETAITQASLKYLECVDLAEQANEIAASLSYGNQRKLEIARALATHPSLLLLDEPAAGMNPTETEELMNLIQKIRRLGITVLLIEHDMKLVMNISDYIYVLDYGQLISEGTPEKVRSDPKVIEAYLGTSEA